MHPINNHYIKAGIILLFIFLSYTVTAQEKREEKIIEGYIQNSMLNLDGLHVLNITNHSATVTNARGNFSIYAALNDTITISSIQFKKAVIKVTDSLFKTQKIEVFLEEAVNELDEVVVTPYGLTGDLKNDLNNYKGGEPINEVSLGLPYADIKPKTKPERELQRISTTLNGGVPLEYLIMALNGELKRLKLHIKIAKEKQVMDAAKSVLDYDILANHFKIPKDYVDRFFDYCSADPAFKKAAAGTPFSFLEYLNTKIADFKKDNNLQ